MREQGLPLLGPNTKGFKLLDLRKNLEIETMIIHESYNPTEQTHDIALLKVRGLELKILE